MTGATGYQGLRNLAIECSLDRMLESSNNNFFVSRGEALEVFQLPERLILDKVSCRPTYHKPSIDACIHDTCIHCTMGNHPGFFIFSDLCLDNKKCFDSVVY